MYHGTRVYHWNFGSTAGNQNIKQFAISHKIADILWCFL